MTNVLIGSILSALATGIGALPILFLKKLSHKWKDIILAFTAGIMLSASTFSLIPQALNTPGSNVIILTIGILLGTIALSLLEKTVPHIDLPHIDKEIKIDSKSLLVISALTLHNIPEGMSVGFSYASESEQLGSLIALAIGLQNAPEGLLIALYLVNQNFSKFKSFLIATATGGIEIITSLLGFHLSSYVEILIPYGLSFAAGAMLFIIYKELIPESHGDGHERVSTYSFIIGLITMIFLIDIFG